MEKLHEWIRTLGRELVPGAKMVDWCKNEDGPAVRGVRYEDGRNFYADKVIIANGSRTPSIPTLREYLPPGLLTAAGVSIAVIQLLQEKAVRHVDVPIMMHVGGSGIFSLPVR